MIRKSALVALAALFAGLVVSCGSQEARQGETTADEPLAVVATFTILGDIVQNVGGEAIEVETLVGPNGDAHNYSATPSDSREISSADLIFENGLEFETWLDDLYESSDSEARRVVSSEDIEQLTFSGEEHGHDEEGHEHADEPGHEDEHHDHTDEEHEEHDHGHEHGEHDPHVWFDAGNAVIMAETVRDALAEADPENSETYERNAEEYIAELEELDAWISGRSEEVLEEDRKLVTSHDTFGYYAEAYGYEVIGTGLSSFSTEASDPSAGETAELVEDIRAAGVPAIFTENVSNSALMEQVAAEAGVELAPPLYTDALGEPGSEGDTYLKMMRYDTRVITEVLGR